MLNDIQYEFQRPDPQAVQAFDDLLVNDRTWILIYLDPLDRWKSLHLSWLIDHRCSVENIPFSLINFGFHNPDIDALFMSAVDSIDSTSDLPEDQTDLLVEQLTGKNVAHWVRPAANLERRRMVFFFDDYQAFESSASIDQRSLFLDKLYRAHLRMPNLRVVIATRENCRIPRTWEHLRAFTYFEFV